MFRTRDFVLLFTAIAFLVSGIGLTLLEKHQKSTVATYALPVSETSDQKYTAEVYVPPEISREEKLAAMKRKIAESSSSVISAPETIVQEESVDSEELILNNDTASSTEPEVEAGAQKCLAYTEFTGEWPISGVSLDVIEGARLVYLTIVSEYELDPLTATSGTVLPSEISRDMLLQLPVSGLPAVEPFCLPTDVVGIAQDGSLIKNNELGLYGIFGANTVVGYALDGFPIYGMSNIKTDTCGGVVVGNNYRYYLSPDRQEIINCFASKPTNL